MIKSNYGRYYEQAHKGFKGIDERYSIKKLRMGWLVYRVHDNQMYGIFPTRLRAYYVATLLSGTKISKLFYFGEGMFK